MSDKELFVANNLLDASVGWQEVVDQAQTPEEKTAAAHEACLSMRSIAGFHGTRKLIVKSELAFIFGDDPANRAIKYREVVVKGWLGRILHVDMLGYSAITWPLYDAQVIKEPEIVTDETAVLSPGDYVQTDGTPRPVYFPVGYIDYALCAAETYRRSH